MKDANAGDHAEGMSPAFATNAAFFTVDNTNSTTTSLASDFLVHKVMDGGGYVTTTNAPCA